MLLDSCLDGALLDFKEEEELYKCLKGFITSRGYTLATILICDDMAIDEDL